MPRTKPTVPPSSVPALPGAPGHVVTLMLVGTAVGFMARFAYDAVLTWSAGGAMRVAAAAAAVAGFGRLGFKLTGRKAWWYATAVLAGLDGWAVAGLAIG